MDYPPKDTASVHAFPGPPLDREDMEELLAARRRDGLQAIFFMLDAMPPGSQVEASCLASLLALAIGD